MRCAWPLDGKAAAHRREQRARCGQGFVSHRNGGLAGAGTFAQHLAGRDPDLAEAFR